VQCCSWLKLSDPNFIVFSPSGSLKKQSKDH